MLIRDDLKAVMEALLFLRGERVSLAELVQVTGLSPSDIKPVMEEIIGDYQQKKHGIQVVKDQDHYIMCTKQQYHNILRAKSRPLYQRLSVPALETLAIIAYKQPVSRGEIENIRGVRCDRTIQTLLEKGLVQEGESPDKPLRGVHYVTTEEFLRVFGLPSLKDLPDLEGF